MSDNGGLSANGRGGEKHTHNYPLSSGKGSIHEGGIRVPMIVKWSDIVSPKSQCDDYLIIEDFYPTILEMAGLEQLKGKCQPIEGHSFIPMLKEKKSHYENRALYWHYPNNWGPRGPGIGTYSAIRKGDWKLVNYNVLNPKLNSIGLEHIHNNLDDEVVDELLDYLAENRVDIIPA